MPELPEVEITKRGVAQHFEGQRLLKCTVREPRLRWPVQNTVLLCEGQVLVRVARRSKYMVMEFGPHALVVHLGMSGSMRIVEHGTAWEKHDHIEWQFDNKLLRYNDPRRFGSVEYAQALPGWQQTYPRFGRLGPEPFDPQFTPAALFEATRGKKVSIKALLLGGEAVVGVGNIYACEALFRSRIRPGKAAGRISRLQAHALHAAVVAVLGEAIERGGSTLRNFQAIDGELGHFQLHCDVYGREGQRCHRCGAVVKRRVMNQRSTFYCPGCQL
ncbi:bifunctional DNA-formamidopyrimidine glycosylase/DNA-(apurinic or apyrimidinic site) lyase [Limnobacter sp.]|uniref:bifunctional DNA-formamidopyrimidine glycosylase/DNA-(apurinic or apyrimidinic site) lyase n=1 Tax=Limnobacter sp. TaxID=2003368 RepID=UPI0035132EA5